MLVLAIDPGPIQSAWLAYDCRTRRPVAFGIESNEQLHEAGEPILARFPAQCLVAIEMVAYYGTGMAPGAEVFDTCVWIGRFMEQFRPVETTLIKRLEIRTTLCGTARAKDPNIRQALVDRWGGKEKAIGYRHCRQCKGRGCLDLKVGIQCPRCRGSGDGRGPLYGVTSHVWAALAVAVTWAEQHGGTRHRPLRAPSEISAEGLDSGAA